jgi:hypothetical protein
MAVRFDFPYLLLPFIQVYTLEKRISAFSLPGSKTKTAMSHPVQLNHLHKNIVVKPAS